MDVKENGKFITVSGWTNDHWSFKNGKNIILEIPKENRETRYRILSVKHCGDPADMYFMDLQHNPRKAP